MFWKMFWEWCIEKVTKAITVGFEAISKFLNALGELIQAIGEWLETLF